jgi:hypothetical protein
MRFRRAKFALTIGDENKMPRSFIGLLPEKDLQNSMRDDCRRNRSKPLCNGISRCHRFDASSARAP